jgi:hypothetical protein
MISEYYVLRLSCDFKEHATEHGDGQAEFHGSDSKACYSQARKLGWKTYQLQRKAKCPACHAERPNA